MTTTARSDPDAPLAPEQAGFVADMSALLVPWGMSPALASIYAYLLLAEAPTTLDAIASGLGIAKSSVSTATRLLERYGLARRHGEPGSKRVRYGASESYSGFLVAQATLLREIGRLAGTRARSVASGTALRRLEYLGSFYTDMAQTIVGRVETLADAHARARAGEDRSRKSAG